MFWSDTARPARIMKAFMDGTHAEVLVNTTLHSPMAVTVDVG